MVETKDETVDLIPPPPGEEQEYGDHCAPDAF